MALRVQGAKEGHGLHEGRRDGELRAGRTMIVSRTRTATFVPDRRRPGEHETGAEAANPRRARAALGALFVVAKSTPITDSLSASLLQ